MHPAPPLSIDVAIRDEAGIYEVSTYTDPRSAAIHLADLADIEGTFGHRQPGTITITQGSHVTIVNIDGETSWLDQSFDDLISAADAAEALTAMTAAGWYEIGAMKVGRGPWRCTARADVDPERLGCAPARYIVDGITLDAPAGVALVAGVGDTADEAVIDAHRLTLRVNLPTAVAA